MNRCYGSYKIKVTASPLGKEDNSINLVVDLVITKDLDFLDLTEWLEFHLFRVALKDSDVLKRNDPEMITPTLSLTL